jgi:YihY family inner membrane protein
MGVLRRTWRFVWGACQNFAKIDGELRAASFAYYAFFSLFSLLPLILFLSSSPVFLDRELPARLIELIQKYVPIENPQDQELIRSTIEGVIEYRAKAGLVGLLCLIWASQRFFHALVVGVNRAWGSREYCWGSLSLKNLAMLGILASALLLGIVVPVVLDALDSFTKFRAEWITWLYRIGRGLVPSLVLFYGFMMFYKFAPRHKVRFQDIWLPSLFVTILLQICQKLFVIYAYQLGHFNVVFGALGGVIILLTWIYLSGMVIIFGGCLCASSAQNRSLMKKARRLAASRDKTREKEQGVLF